MILKLKETLVRFRLPILTVISFIVGFSISQIFIPQRPFPITEIRSPGNYKFINPLIECELTNFSEDKSLDNLKNKLKNIIDQKINNQEISFASVYYRNLNNGPWLGINEDELFSPSSLIKVPLMIAYFELTETYPNLLQQELTNTKTYNPAEQNIAPEISLAPNHKYTIGELINRMIIYSDNLAYDLLNQNIDQKLLINTYNNLGVDITKAYDNPTGNILSVKAYASFFRILYNSSYLDKNLSEKALKLLSQSKFKDGIVSGVPPDITVAHKFGERQYLDTHERQLHDCGIVYLPQKPYLICIMTRGQNITQLETTIKNISSTVYQEIKP
jgi:beta-lactamase class A